VRLDVHLYPEEEIAMPGKELVIKVAGEPGAGKTTIARLLAEALESVGFRPEMHDEGSTGDYASSCNAFEHTRLIQALQNRETVVKVVTMSLRPGLGIISGLIAGASGMLKFNFNEYVRVQLTEHAESVIREHNADLGLGDNYMPRWWEERTEALWVKVQLWELMSYLGPGMSMGGPQLIKDGAIYFDGDKVSALDTVPKEVE
jgi:hypothetical protein